MATPAQLAAKLSALLIGIKNLINGKLDKGAIAADSSKLEGSSLAQVMSKTVNEQLAQMNGRRGEVAFFTQDGTPGAVAGGELLTQLRMASDDAAINTLKSSTVSFADIFNKWPRFSHGANLVFPNTPAELSGWAYDAGTDRISSTINSSSFVGIISNDRFDSYEFETIMKSNNGDDDGIGMCLAFKQVGGREHTVCVLVDGGGLDEFTVVNGKTAKLQVIVNYNQGNANGRATLFKQDFGIPAQAWNGADLSQGVRVVAKRSVTGLLEITSTRADGTPWPTPVSWSGMLPAMFLTKCPIGYVQLSQPDSTWQNLKLPTSKRDIIDTRDLTVWRWNVPTGAWINAGKANDPWVMTPGRLYKNTEGNMAAYYLDFEGNFITLGIPAIL